MNKGSMDIVYALNANFYFSFMIVIVNLWVPTCVRWKMNDVYITEKPILLIVID